MVSRKEHMLCLNNEKKISSRIRHVSLLLFWVPNLLLLNHQLALKHSPLGHINGDVAGLGASWGGVVIGTRGLGRNCWLLSG